MSDRTAFWFHGDRGQLRVGQRRVTGAASGVQRDTWRVLLWGLALCAVVPLVLGCAAGAGGVSDEAAEREYPTDERPMSSVELIDAAVSSGALDYSTGLLYKVYVMFSPTLLPSEFQSDVPSKSGASLVSEVRRNWNLLDPADRAEISNYIQPPGEPGDEDGRPLDMTPDRPSPEPDDLN